MAKNNLLLARARATAAAAAPPVAPTTECWARPELHTVFLGSPLLETAKGSMRSFLSPTGPSSVPTTISPETQRVIPSVLAPSSEAPTQKESG